ncbi:MAG: alpha/beta fold hydrolase [Stackebrandtia sp.]
MPTVDNHSVPIYCEASGTGFPVLLIPGMASTLEWFAFNVPAFADHYRVIAQDLRGSNRDGIPAAAGPYSTRDMAADSIALLDALAIDRAHVVAQSMTFTPDFQRREPERWRYYADHIGSRPPRPETLRAQVFAALEHDSLDRLGGVNHDVRLLVGDQDVINVALAPDLADALPSGRLSILPGMPHALNFEFAELFDDVAEPERDPSLHRRLHLAVAAFLRKCRTERETLRALHQAGQQREAHAGQWESFRDRLRERVVRDLTILRHRDHLPVHTNVDLVATVVTRMLEGVALHVVSAEAVDIDELAAATADLYFHGVFGTDVISD